MAEEEDSCPVPRTPQRCSDSGGNPPRKTQLNKPNQSKRRIQKNQTKNMRAAKTDKFGFHRNPSFSAIGSERSYTLKQLSGDRDNRVSAASEPQKKAGQNRSKRPARSGRDKYDSSPGSPFFGGESKLSERKFPAVCAYKPPKRGSAHRETGSQRCFF